MCVCVDVVCVVVYLFRKLGWYVGTCVLSGIVTMVYREREGRGV